MSLPRKKQILPSKKDIVVLYLISKYEILKKQKESSFMDICTSYDDFIEFKEHIAKMDMKKDQFRATKSAARAILEASKIWKSTFKEEIMDKSNSNYDWTYESKIPICTANVDKFNWWNSYTDLLRLHGAPCSEVGCTSTCPHSPLHQQPESFGRIPTSPYESLPALEEAPISSKADMSPVESLPALEEAPISSKADMSPVESLPALEEAPMSSKADMSVADEDDSSDWVSVCTE